MVNIVRNFLIMLNNPTSFRTASKRVIQKTPVASVNLIGNKIANRITKIRRGSPQKQLQMNMKNKYLKKDIYFQKKDRNLWIV